MASSPLIHGGADPARLTRTREILYGWPWHLVAFLLRLFYGFSVEARERLPRQGPFILVINEYSPIAFLISGWVSLVALGESLRRNRESISFMRQELFEFRFFRNALTVDTPGKFAALTPQGAGKLALSLLEGYRVLQAGGIVIMNPEGDMPWDGRPLPLGHALAWLALHSAAPIVPAITTIGAYDIWPRWQTRMNWGGRVALRFGQPFRVCPAPVESVTDRDIAAAEIEMRRQFDDLRYGPGGLSEWAGKPMRRNVHLISDSEHTPAPRLARRPQPVWKRGMALLLWRCPVCHTCDALYHHRPRFGPQTLECDACQTRWRIRRIPGRDFLLTVIKGPAELVGLEMPLTAWYDEVKRDFAPRPIPISGLELMPGEEVLLEASGVSLWTTLDGGFDLANRGEPPRLLKSPAPAGEWKRAGEGRLVLSSARLIRQAADGQLEWNWARVSSIVLWMFNTLTIQYGAVPYRFDLGQENGLKWLSYAGTAARCVADRTGQKLDVSRF